MATNFTFFLIKSSYDNKKKQVLSSFPTPTKLQGHSALEKKGFSIWCF